MRRTTDKQMCLIGRSRTFQNRRAILQIRIPRKRRKFSFFVKENRREKFTSLSWRIT